MSRFLVYIKKYKDGNPEDSAESAQVVLQASTPPKVSVESFTYGCVQVAYSGRVSIHRDENTGLLLLLSGYFRHVGSSSEYSEDAKDLLSMFNEHNDLLAENFEGCFSLLVCDLNSLDAWLMTDRFGTRPLYYDVSQRHITISSEKYLLLPWIDDLVIPAKALTDSFWLGFTRAPETLISGIAKVEDNTLVKIASSGAVEKHTQECPFVLKPDYTFDFDEVVSRIDAALENEFVMLGRTKKKAAVLLSGGIDSSIMAAYASKHFSECVAFTCKIEGFDNPELERAIYVAEKLGLKHEIVNLNLDDLDGLFTEVATMLEGPSRHINNLVMRRIFQEITGYDAIIGGDAADTLFGQPSDRAAINIEKKVALAARLPGWLRSIVSAFLTRTGYRKRDHIKRILNKDIESVLVNLFAIEYSDKETRIFEKLEDLQFSRIPLSAYKSPGIVGKAREASFSLFLRCMLERNTLLSSDSDVPIYYPFLSEEMLSISRQFQYEHRFDEAGNAKPVLRELCKRLVDSKVIEWPKIGFETPEKTWLTNELKSHLNRVFTNTGGINSVLGVSLDSEDIAIIESSKHIIWWLMTLDVSLLEMEARISAWQKG